MEILLISLLLGTVTGIILALTGAGGAIIAIPLLVFGLSIPMAQAAPVALLAVAISATIAAWIAFNRLKIVRYRAAGLIAVVGMLIAPLGIWVAQFLPDLLLTLLFSMVLAYVGWRMFQSPSQHKMPEKSALPDSTNSTDSAPCQFETARGRLIWNEPCAKALALAGLTTGFLSGLLGVGGGFIIIPALKHATTLPMQSLIATSLAAIALISTIGFLSAAFIGAMRWAIAIPFSVGAVSGMLIGRRYTDRINETLLQRGFAIVAGCIALGMIVHATLVFF
ncbi:MAG: sulfite exporter TauE/SafE family protein [Nitrosomonas sp.]|nr:sulfite exporter TauE/SafE family protein [Nitrosomonas sp.]